MIPRSTLPKGATATVSGLTLHGEERLRLLEQGLLPGVTVRMVTPGDPCVAELHGFRLSLCGKVAGQVQMVDESKHPSDARGHH